VFAVMCTRTYRTVAAVKAIVTALPVAGLNTRPADAESVLNDVPSVLPCTLSVCVRVAHADGGGNFSTTWSIATPPPRSTWIHCGKTLFGLSQ
jgi:hypothetical protein